jgi:hypothetical protein
LRKAASTKAESTTAESVIRPKQLLRKNVNIELAYFFVNGFLKTVHKKISHILSNWYFRHMTTFVPTK